MLIGVPKEIKNHEYRVGMTPISVREAVRDFCKNGVLRFKIKPAEPEE